MTTSYSSVQIYTSIVDIVDLSPELCLYEPDITQAASFLWFHYLNELTSNGIRFARSEFRVAPLIYWVEKLFTQLIKGAFDGLKF